MGFPITPEGGRLRSTVGGSAKARREWKPEVTVDVARVIQGKEGRGVGGNTRSAPRAVPLLIDDVNRLAACRDDRRSIDIDLGVIPHIFLTHSSG
jgi:hypothetical protein